MSGVDANGLALTNMGDVRVQTLAGALQTGTHGCGRATGTFADMVVGLELVLGDGLIVTVDANNDPDLFNSARVGLGAFGIVTAITLAVEPRFRLHAHEFPASFEEVSASFDAWTAAHDHVEFYWFPHTGKCLVKHNDRTYDDAQPPASLRTGGRRTSSNTVFGAMSLWARCTWIHSAPQQSRRPGPVRTRLRQRLVAGVHLAAQCPVQRDGVCNPTFGADSRPH